MNTTVTLARLIKLAAFVAFLVALAVAESWASDFGTWQEWAAGGLALTTLADLA